MMKNCFFSPNARGLRQAILLLAAWFGLSVCGRAGAATLTWDAVAGNGALDAGGGTWNTSLNNWTADAGASNTTWNNATPDNAIFGGGTAGTAGTVALGSAITAGSLTFSTPSPGNYTIGLNGNVLTLNSGVSAGESAVISGAGTLLLGANNAWSVATGKTLSVSSAIDDGASDFSLTKTDVGTLTLSGANSYSGGTTVTAGTLVASHSSALGSGAVTLNGGTLNTSVNLANAIVLNAVAGNTIAPNGFYRVLSGQISGAGGLTLASGGGTPGLAFSNATNNFSGALTINAEVFLRTITSEVIPNTANVTNNGRLRLDVAGGGTETIAGLTGSGSIWVPLDNNSLQTLVVGATDATGFSYSGTVGAADQNNAYLALKKTGTGTQTLTGSLLHTAGTTVDGGILSLAAFPGFPAGSGSTGQFTAAHTLTVNPGATLRMSGDWVMGGGLAHQINVNGGTLAFSGTDNYQGKISLTGGAITTSGGIHPWRTGNWGNGQITTNASATTSTISGNLTFVGTAAAPKTIFTVADGAAAVDLSFTGNIYDHPGFEGMMQMVKTGPGTMSMTNGKSWTGGTLLAQGTLQIVSTGALGVGTVTVNDATTGSVATSLLATGAITIANNIVVSNNGSGTITIGSTDFNPGAVPTLFDGTLQLNRATTLRGGNTDRTTYTNVISGNVGALTISGNRRTTFQSANTFVGSITITGSGTILQVGDGGGTAQTQLGAANALTLEAGNFFYLNVGDNGSVTAGSLAGGGTVQLHPGVGGTQTLIVGTDNTNTSFSGTMGNGGGAFQLRKTGTGTLTLTGTSGYSGTTTVTGGTLEISGAGGALTGSSGISVTGGTLLVGGTAADRLNNATTVSLNRNSHSSAALAFTGSITESMGAFSLLSDSVIDMGSGATQATFSTITSWSGVLRVWNWTGSIWSDLGADHLDFSAGTGVPTPTQLEAVQFYSDGGLTPVGSGATFLNGELVPVPEPGAAMSGVLLLIPVLWRSRRAAVRGR